MFVGPYTDALFTVEKSTKPALEKKKKISAKNAENTNVKRKS